jgi:general secretion pathway protein C
VRTSTVNRAVAYLAAAALAVPLGFAGLQAWELLREATEPAGPAAAEDAHAPDAQGEELQPGLERIAGWHLFGRPPEQTVAAPRAPVEAPKTRLQLTLRGVMASGAAGEARAIIAEPGGRERQYRPGQAVPGGAELAEVRPDRVILQRNGRYETLPLVRAERVGGDDGASGALMPGMARQRRFLPQTVPEPAAEPVEAPAPEQAEEQPQ